MDFFNKLTFFFFFFVLALTLKKNVNAKPLDEIIKEIKDEVKRNNERCTVGLADVVFILDESTSILKADFQRQKDFVVSLVNKFDIGPDTTRIGLITFGTYARPIMRLGRQSTKAGIIKVIESITQRHGETNTGDALYRARRGFFPEAYGGRPGQVPQIAIVVTDGNAQDRYSLKRQAIKLRDDGVIVFALGVGPKVSHDELQVIASGEDFILAVNDYSKLSTIEEQLSQKACNVPRPNQPAVEAACHAKEGDVIFLLNTASDIYKIKYHKMLAFAQSIVYALDVGKSKTRVGAISYSDKPELVLELVSEYSYQGIAESIGAITKSGSGNDVASAIHLARSKGFNERYGGRPGIAQAIVLITDRKTDNLLEAVMEAKKTRTEAIEIFAVGVGPNVDESELKSLTSTGSAVFKVDSYDDLHDVTTDVAVGICEIEAPNKDEGCGWRSGADIAFVMDTKNAGQTDAIAASDFIRTVASEFAIGSDKVRVAQLPTTCLTLPGFQFNTFQTKEAVLSGMQVQGNHALTALLSDVREQTFQTDNGARDGLRKIAIVVTDEKPADAKRTLMEAMKTKLAGIEVFVVGVGDEVNRELLKQVASDPAEQHLILVPDYDSLKTAHNVITSDICKELDS